jgi:Ni/Fe-hydrogenase subunit HybB-like protein/Fe-S-cluster-containing dehydrogenase component
MQPARRDLLRFAGGVTALASGLCGPEMAHAAEHAVTAGHGPVLSPDVKGVLVDLTECVGCRLCEYACKRANGFETGPLESYDDTSVFRTPRRPGTRSLTVVNAWPTPTGPTTTATAPTTSTADANRAAHPVYTKVNCMHCNHAGCVSACIVGAMSKDKESGAVTYDAWKCIGCRYCMVACPFQVPAYEYDNVLTPQVRKCEFCQPRTSRGELPACVKECPRQALVYGKRSELIELAHKKIHERPERYVAHVYGEHEVGGTSWLYLSGVPFEQAGFLPLGNAAPPALTEAIQHGVFKHWIAPIGWYTFLATAMWFTGRKSRLRARHPAAADDPPDASPTEQEDEEQPGGTTVTRASGPCEWPSHERSGGLLTLERLAHGPEARVTGNSTRSHAHAQAHPSAAPVPRKLLTPGVWVLISMVLVGVACGLYRFIAGLAAATNLDQQHPWGLWIAMDVGSGIALAGGGFVTATLVHIFHREHYHAVARSALLTALLGYTFYVPGLLADIGRWYNIWHPTLPNMWQGNSVLFEVGICVMLYLNVQYAEMAPIVCQRLLADAKDGSRLAPYRRWIQLSHDVLERIMPALLVLGVALSTFHQSSLGNLMVIAPYKLHALWWTPLSPLLFLMSAMMVGFPMVIFTLLFASWSLKRRPEMHVLAPLSIYAVVLLTLYFYVKVGDMVARGTYTYLEHFSVPSAMWLIEVVSGVVVPLVMLLLPATRRTPRRLGLACLLVIFGVVVNRLNVFVIAYHPPFATRTYVPSIAEFGVSLGLVAALMLTYRVAVTYLPILEPAAPVRSSG